jgi:hypothetical protein
MATTFWIETVEHKIVIPIFKLGETPLLIAAPTNRSGQPSPVFHVEPPRDIPEPITITVSFTQLQYWQIVFLNFWASLGPMSHLSGDAGAKRPRPDSTFRLDLRTGSRHRTGAGFTLSGTNREL